MSNYLDGIKVGDKVWSANFGRVEVIRVRDDDLKEIITIRSPYSEGEFYYNYKGKLTLKCGIEVDINQTLFWDEIKITPPPRPRKEKEKRELIGWGVLKEVPGFKNIFFGDDRSLNSFVKKEDAEKNIDKNTISVVEITFRWEE